MKLRIFAVVVCIQVIGITILFIHIQNKRNSTLGVSINPISSKTIQQASVDGLKYFFEPKANTVEESHRDWLTYVPKYTINSDTLNERFNYDVKKKEGVFRIIALGDSFTFGQNVSTERNWTELLEDYLNTHKICNIVKKYEVINLGVYGYDTQYEVERYKIRGQKYNPDLVIMLFGDFQLFRLNEELRKRENKIKQMNPKINSSLGYVKALDEMISDLGWNVILDWQKNQIMQITNSIESKKLLVKFPISCNNKGQYILNTQSYNQYFECWPFITYNNLFKDISIKRNDIYFFNDFIWESKYSLQDGHPSAEGHKIIAENILLYLLKNNLIPCTQQTSQ